jgi:hypothetical protein
VFSIPSHIDDRYMDDSTVCSGLCEDCDAAMVGLRAPRSATAGLVSFVALVSVLCAESPSLAPSALVVAIGIVARGLAHGSRLPAASPRGPSRSCARLA